MKSNPCTIARFRLIHGKMQSQSVPEEIVKVVVVFPISYPRQNSAGSDDYKEGGWQTIGIEVDRSTVQWMKGV